jgi:hypothetical protein
VLVACGLALCVNPYGTRLVVFPLQMQADWIRSVNAEFQSALQHYGWSLVEGGYYHHWIRWVFFLYLLILLGVVIETLRRWRTRDLVPVAVMVIWLLASLRHLRTVSDTVVLTWPLVAAAVGPDRWQTWRWPWGVSLGLLLGVLGLAWPEIELGRHPPPWDHGGPRCVAAMIARRGRPVRVYGFGRVTLQYWLPDLVRVHFFWEFVAGPAHHADVRALGRDPAALPPYLDRHGVDLIVLVNTPHHYLVPILHAAGWVLVHIDDHYLAFQRQADAQPGSIYRVMRPWKEAPVTDAWGLLTEANRAITRCPEHANVAWRSRAAALRQLGRHDEAAAAARKAPGQLMIREIP